MLMRFAFVLEFLAERTFRIAEFGACGAKIDSSREHAQEH